MKTFVIVHPNGIGRIKGNLPIIYQRSHIFTLPLREYESARYITINIGDIPLDRFTSIWEYLNGSEVPVTIYPEFHHFRTLFPTPLLMRWLEKFTIRSSPASPVVPLKQLGEGSQSVVILAFIDGSPVAVKGEPLNNTLSENATTTEVQIAVILSAFGSFFPQVFDYFRCKTSAYYDPSIRNHEDDDEEKLVEEMTPPEPCSDKAIDPFLSRGPIEAVFTVMEVLQQDYIGDEKLPYSERKELAKLVDEKAMKYSFIANICCVLQILYDNYGFLHGDLKNIMFRKWPEPTFTHRLSDEIMILPTHGYLPVIMDFGFSKMMKVSLSTYIGDTRFSMFQDIDDLIYYMFADEGNILLSLLRRYTVEMQMGFQPIEIVRHMKRAGMI